MTLPSKHSHLVGWIRTGATVLLGFAAPACSDRQTASTVEPARTVDEGFQPEIPDPAFPLGEGPVVCVDEAHNEFHSVDGTYRPFANVLIADGYRIRSLTEPASAATLGPCAILVVPDAQPPARPRDPPTFSAEEVQSLNEWVRRGGSLFLITDHQPDPGVIADLAASFGIEVSNGYVLNGAPAGPERPLLFRADDGTLTGDTLLQGAEAEDALAQVATFTGSALRGGDTFRPLLVFGPGRESWLPEEYWVFEEDTPRSDVTGWSQGGVQEWGAGRVAVFGEAAMFTAQVFEEGTIRAGMNAPEATDNLRLLRRVMRWLAGAGVPGAGSAGGAGGDLHPAQAPGHSTVWYLGHSSYAMQIGGRLLVFDYTSSEGTPSPHPEAGGLDDGVIAPGDLRGLETLVFVTHAHGDHYDPVVLSWERWVGNLHYFFGWQAGTAESHHYMVGPRATADVDGVRVYTVNSAPDGIPEVAFLVEVDGIWIYHNGDHYVEGAEDLDYLGGITPRVDVAFLPAVQAYSETWGEKEVRFLERFRPRAVFPVHRGGREEEYRAWAESMADRGLRLNVLLPEARGDRFELEALRTGGGP